MTAWLVVGLGNPGPTYASHRHNAGYLVVDELAARAGVSFTAPKGMRSVQASTRIAEHGIGGVGPKAERVVLLKGRTFMNESGGPVNKALAYHQIPLGRLVVVHDELDLDFGRLRLKLGGGDNGHNGLKSIRQAIGSGDFYRVRVGIGRPPGRQDPAAYVLTPYPASVREELALQVDTAADAVEALLLHGLTQAQNRFNS